MTVTSVRKVSSKKLHIVLDEETEFTVYRHQLSQWNMMLSEGQELSEDESEQLLKKAERLAASYAMDRLVRRDYAEKELYMALKRGGFSDDLASAGIKYVNSYGYIDDSRFAREYTDSRKDTISSRMLRMKLRQKGIADDVISRTLEESSWNDCEAIHREIRKKFGDTIPDAASKDYQKLIRSLLRKGYKYSDVKKVLETDLYD